MEESKMQTFRRMLATGALVFGLGACGSSDASEAETSDGTGTIDAGGSASNDSDADDGGFCELVRAEIVTTQDSDDSFGDLAEYVRELIDAAPDELHDDLELVADTYDQLSELADGDEEAYAEFEQSNRLRFDEANENLARYAAEECGIDL